MNNDFVQLFFALLRLAVFKVPMSDCEKALVSPQTLKKLYLLSDQHSVAHIIGQALTSDGLALKGDKYCELLSAAAVKEAFRHEEQQFLLDRLCEILESAEIPFVPLKGAVLRELYPEQWLRNSCDIDVLVHREDLDRAIKVLIKELEATEGKHDKNDITLLTKNKRSVELHFDLLEEGRANGATKLLSTVWDNVLLKPGCRYQYLIKDEFFYFYHIAHMAKHFEVGGCGVRSFVDLMLLEKTEHSEEKRNIILKKGGLLKFAENARLLSEVWFNGAKPTELILKMQDYILRGGVYGSSENRVAVAQAQKGGKKGYFLSRVFAPTEKLKRLYPILERQPWLMPFMQVRRWFLLLKPGVRSMAKRELAANKNTDQEKAVEMGLFLKEIGL